MGTPIAAGTYNGMSWGGASSPYRIQAAVGFQDLPSLRRRVTAHSQADGAARSMYRLDEHILQLTLHIVAVSGATVDQSCRALELATPRNATTPLPLVFDSGTKRVIAFVANRTIVPGTTDRYARAVIQWELSDPKVYSEPATTISSSIGSTISAPTVGNDKSGWIATISGACTNPRITLGSDTIKVPRVMGGGDVLVIDAYGLTCLLNNVRVSETTSSDWFLLNPGANSVVLAADSGTPSVSFVYRSSWA